MQKAFLFAAACLALASCGAQSGAPAAPEPGAAPASSGELLPAVTDQELDDLIDTVMQGVDIPRR